MPSRGCPAAGIIPIRTISIQDYINIGRLTNTRYILAGLLQQIPGGQYSIQFSIIDAVTGESAARYMKNGSLINEASEDMLSQMGVRLTDAGRAALLRGRAAAVHTETGFAKGVVAQESGDSVGALLNYTQSIAFDPSQLEAVVRSARRS